MSRRSAMLIGGGLALLMLLAFLLRDSLRLGARPLVIATLIQRSGPDVTRDFARQLDSWSEADVGARFSLGDGLRTGPEAQVTLRLADASQLSVMPGTTLRFLLDADTPTGLNVDLERGEAVVQAGERDLAIQTHVGRAVLKAGSSVKLDRSGDELDILVQLGSVQLQNADGQAHLLEGGANVRVGIGLAVLGPAPVDVTVAALEASVDAGPDAAHGETAADGPELAAPEHIDMSTPAGESFVLHAPELPVAVSIDFAQKCPGEAELELVGKRQRLRGKDHIAIALKAGVVVYVVRCLSKNGRTGRKVGRATLRVVKDAGTRKLPPKAPTSFVDTDGRTYRIYYPNQLPDIQVRWPNAPQEASYQLEIDGKTQAVPGPELLLPSGQLRDGIHQLSFRGTIRRSRTTTIDLRFDNNAPTASLAEPADGSFSPGSEVKVEGVSLEAWKVSLAGGTITKQTDGRFSGTIAPTAERPDIAVRLSHPRLGVHYYLRRAAPSP